MAEPYGICPAMVQYVLMRRAVLYLALWAGATALAVTLSWLGVRDVLRGAVFDRPGAIPAGGPVIHASPAPPATGGTPAATARPSRPARRPAPVPGRPSATHASPSASSRAADVRSFASRGGRAAFTLTPAAAHLVSATPAQGYGTKVTPGTGWLRVDFTAGDRTSSIIASWYQHAPTVQVYEY
ncbi:hypothetical protein ACRYCC_41850 [Actinomadura scrupuli]|uniref:hypothetical protein n=1 Tax=Actinomadura scrupuli TaxID=559629 RepID=UPI003D963A24